jgi:quinol monooxygenase YgiN
MSEVNIIATLTPFPEFIDTIRHAARAMVAPTHKEAGCLQYDLHESHAIPDVRDLSQRVTCRLSLSNVGNLRTI